MPSSVSKAFAGGSSCCRSTSITSSSLLYFRQPLHASTTTRRRNYATVNHDSSSQQHDSNSMPDWPKSPHPTPYDIFDIKKDAPYTKKRFYQLVKLYHPDKQHVHHQQIPHQTRLERYRLVVAANDLLSDPVKRRLYDGHGIGWSGTGRAQTAREADRAWRHQPGSAAHNATWEDWERWHDARDGKPKQPLYMSNGLFATVVVMMCMIGAFAQMSRADHAGAEYMHATNAYSGAISKKLSQTTRSAAGLSKNERVDTFLRDRENVAYSFVPAKFDRPDEGTTTDSSSDGHNE